jgi:hypothetical protein
MSFPPYSQPPHHSQPPHPHAAFGYSVPPPNIAPPPQKLSTFALVLLYGVALGVPLLGAGIVLVVTRIADRLTFFASLESSARLAHFRRHGLIAGMTGIAVWFGLPITIGFIDSKLVARHPPVEAPVASACDVPLALLQQVQVVGYLAMPPGVSDPCDEEPGRCVLDFYEGPPTTKRGATRVSVAILSGRGRGLVAVERSSFSAKDENGMEVDGSVPIMVVAKRAQRDGGKCMLHVDDMYRMTTADPSRRSVR